LKAYASSTSTDGRKEEPKIVQLQKLSYVKWKPYLSLLGKPQLPLFWVSDFMPQHPLSWVSDFMQIMNCRLDSPTPLPRRGESVVFLSPFFRFQL
jgi:hypothetical protein